jgi:hypothetical protein
VRSIEIYKSHLEDLGKEGSKMVSIPTLKHRKQKPGSQKLQAVNLLDQRAMIEARQRHLNHHDVGNLVHVPSNLQYHGYNYTQVCRGARCCVYRQTLGEKIIGFEIFIISIQQEIILYGKVYKSHERWPKDRDYGKTAWSCWTLK